MIYRLCKIAFLFFLGITRAFSALGPGDEFELNGLKGKVIEISSVAVVSNEFTKVAKFDHFDNPKLKQLRDEYRLAEITASGKSEFEKQLLLMHWVHNQFKKFGTPTIKPRGGLEILSGIQDGHTFFCAQYAQLFVSAAASMGHLTRELALRRHQDMGKGGSTEHSTTEIWSNQYRKWIMLDPTSNMYLEKGGLPLNAYEIRHEWFQNEGKELRFVIGRNRKIYKKADLPVVLRTFSGFGDLTVAPDELDKYGFIGYIPNNNFMDAGEDYAHMIITKDELCNGTKWHTRQGPKDPAISPYYPLNQVEIYLDEQLNVKMATLTPNLLHYYVRTKAKKFIVTNSFTWQVERGTNQLEISAVNQFGITGPVSTATVILK